jgi:hypothetical protein
MERAVARDQAQKPRRLPPLIGVDEKAMRKARKCLTVVCDLERSRLSTSARIAGPPAWAATWKPRPRRAGPIKAIATDTWEPYIAFIQELPSWTGRTRWSSTDRCR